MRFKAGDMVICVDNSLIHLELNKLYIISYVENIYYLYLNINGTIIGGYRESRFKLLSEVRKQKLKQLRNEI
jgi:hypothetical protein